MQPSRALIWVERLGVGGWGCAECSWVFTPSGLVESGQIQELIEWAQEQLHKEFAGHVCADYQRATRGQAG
jgi:hypothetical protein